MVLCTASVPIAPSPKVVGEFEVQAPSSAAELGAWSTRLARMMEPLAGGASTSAPDEARLDATPGEAATLAQRHTALRGPSDPEVRAGS